MKPYKKPRSAAATSRPYAPASAKDEAADLLRKLDIFDNVVSHGYLTRLSGCEVVPQAK